MAGKITHIEVLAQVSKHLDHGSANQRKIAELLLNPLFKKYACVGAIFPDIFYFYHFYSPLRTKKAQFWGDTLHHENPILLAVNFLEEIRDMEEGITKNKLIAFTFGFICHCIVDIVTHPYIFYISGDYYSKDPKISSNAQINHLKVEFALDSYLLNFRWGMNPHKYDFNKYVDIRVPNNPQKMDSLIWEFILKGLKKTYQDKFFSSYIGSEKKIIPGDLINDSYIGFLDFHNVLDSRSVFMRGFLKTFDFLTLYKFKSSVLVLPVRESINIRIMNEEKRPWFYPSLPSKMSNENFIELVNRSALDSISILTLSDSYINGEIKKEDILKDYDGYNLDTGIRYRGVNSMKEFSPIGEES